MPASRYDRIESYYQESARGLATMLVDSEDEVEKLEAEVRMLTAEVSALRAERHGA